MGGFAGSDNAGKAVLPFKGDAFSLGQSKALGVQQGFSLVGHDVNPRAGLEMDEPRRSGEIIAGAAGHEGLFGMDDGEFCVGGEGIGRRGRGGQIMLEIAAAGFLAAAIDQPKGPFRLVACGHQSLYGPQGGNAGALVVIGTAAIDAIAFHSAAQRVAGPAVADGHGIQMG